MSKTKKKLIEFVIRFMIMIAISAKMEEWGAKDQKAAEDFASEFVNTLETFIKEVK